MKNLISMVAFVTAFGLGAASHAAPTFPGPDLVVNGNFESTTSGAGELSTLSNAYNTNLTGWNNNGYNFVFASGTGDTTGSPSAQFGNNLSLWGKHNGSRYVLPASSPAGGNFVALDGAFETGPLSQTLTGLTPGGTVAVSFYYGFAQQHGFDGVTNQSLDVSLGSTTQSTANFVVDNHGFTGWQFGTFYFHPTSTTETLSFLAHGDLPVPPFALLDGVTANAVPEPATWALTLIGLGGLGALARRRRALSAVAA